MRSSWPTPAFGQAEVLVTPLQMALVAATIANDGVLMQPKLVDELISESGSSAVVSPETLRRVMSTQTASEITAAMVRAVNGPFSPAYAGGARIPGVLTAGKSGSAQLGTGQRPHSWFIGFAPADHPEIAVAIVVERGGSGSQRAVPMGGDLMGLYLKLRGG